MTFLQFNPHGECFGPKRKCYRKGSSLIRHLLHDRSIDFASLIYTHSLFRPPKKWKDKKKLCKTRFVDDVSLVYNSRKWKTISGMSSDGCIGDDGGRPFIVQAFSNKQSDFKVVVLAAHFPHAKDYFAGGRLIIRQAIKDVKDKSGIDKVVVIADTNLPDFIHYDDDKFKWHLNLRRGDSELKSTQLRTTCCHPRFTFKGYDRIVANFGWKMTTFMPMPLFTKPSWITKNFHLPLVGKLDYV